MVLEFPYLTLRYSKNFDDNFVFVSCLHVIKTINMKIKKGIDGRWDCGDYHGERTNRL